jgi:hypothetical protein
MNIPEQLKDRQQWLVWRFVTKPGQKKPAKMPYYANGNLRGWPHGKPRDGEPTADQPQVEQGHDLDRAHLVDFETAAETAALRDFDGVGFAFLPGDGLIGIDLDAACADKHASIRDACQTFAERSPSGTGLHIIGFGETETFKSNDVGIEVFCGRQFFTVTGEHDTASPIELREIPAETLTKLRRTVEQAKQAAKQAREAAKPVQPSLTPSPAVAANADASRYCLSALESAVQRLRSASEGGRNDLLNGEAYGLAQIIHTGGISEATIRAALQDAAQSCGLPPGEAKATISSGIRAGLQSPRPIPQRETRPPAARPQPAPPVIDPETGEILDAPEPANDNAVTEWSDPIDLFGTSTPPDLPIDVLPEAIRDYVRDQAELLGCDPAIIGLCSLVAAAACIHDGIELQPKRHDLSWTEQARLWVAVVGDPSARKSPAIGKAVRHTKKIDINMADENAAAISDWRWQHESWKEAKKADKSTPIAEPQQPAKKRLVVEDATIEALSDVLKDNPRGVLTLKDELTGWFASMDAYKGGTKGASMDRALWLEAYNGGRRVVDRVQRGTIVIPNWSTCIIGGIQPDMMRRISSSMGNDGLLQRFIVLIAKPASQDVDRVPDKAASDRFSRLFDQLIQLQPSESRIYLSDPAHVIRERVGRLANRMIAAFDHPHIQAWLGKWTGLFGRLLTTYHVIECASDGVYPSKRPVSGETAGMVERLMCDVLLHHAIHFYTEVIDAHERQENVRQLARTILAKGFDRITRRDLTLHWKTSRKLEAWEVRATLETLCNMAWLEPDMSSVDASDGKPKAWLVNPRAHEMFSGQAEREARRRREAADVVREIRAAGQQQ